MSDDDFLRVTDVSKWYGDEQVLNEVSFEMNRGDVTVLIGPSGSGKSTMLRCVNRLAE
ncbi:glutamine ABC transporter ATP-binding protein, partial [Halorubrum sp. E3]